MGDALPSGIETDLAVHIDVKSVLCLADSRKQLVLFSQQIEKELRNIGDLLIVFGFGGDENSLILSFCHHLVPQIGVLHLRDIGVMIQDALGFVHKGLELVLVTKRFFQIHIHSPRH